MKHFKSLAKYCLCTSNVRNKSKFVQIKNFTQIQVKELMEKPNQLRDLLLNQIDTYGSLQMQKYWSLALTHPQFGFYSKKNVFSSKGDFITSPQISKLFGEMVAVWIICFLKKVKIWNEQNRSAIKKFRIVELGGGRGALMVDILRAFSDWKLTNDFDISFIQISEFNRKAQQDAVLQQFKKQQHYFKFQYKQTIEKYQQFTSQNSDKNVSLRWFDTIEHLFFMDHTLQENNKVQPPFTIFVMNQFFDALPSIVLRYTQSGWRQKVLVRSQTPGMFFDFAESSTKLADKMTPMSQNTKVGDEIQMSYISLMTMDTLSKMVNKSGGAIINIDYGDDGVFSDSIRAIKQHRYVPSPYFWQIPGECDLSAYVNFRALGQFAEKMSGMISYPTLPQGYFLQAMGIVDRVDVLKQKANDEVKKRLDSQYQRLVLPTEMGELYKVQIISKKQYGQIYPFITYDDTIVV